MVIPLRNDVGKFSDLETFICVCETESFTAAARRLNVGQPAVSKAVARLEQQLNTRLMLRSTHGLRPTDAGQQLYQRAKRILNELAETESLVREGGAGLSGRLRVSSAAVFARIVALPDLTAFLQANPRLGIDLLLDDGNLSLIEEGVDIALCTGSLDDSSFTARKLGEIEQCVMGTPAYFSSAGVPLRPEDLAQHEMVVYQRRSGAENWSFSRHGETRALRLQGRMRVNAAECLRELVLSGFGATVAGEGLFRSELQSGAIMKVMTDWQLPPLELWAVFPGGHFAPAKARAFADVVQQALCREP
nr:LysR family transcriptional regulator [Serratia plymuthica]